MLTNRQIAFAAAYVLSFTVLAVIGYCVGDYSFRTKVQKIQAAEHSVIEGDTAFYDLPLMNMTIVSSSGDHSLVRLDMSLEVKKNDLTRVDSYEPRITDHLLDYLRRQDLDALREANQQNEFKTQLLEETNKASYPVKVMDIVFRRFIIL